MLQFIRDRPWIWVIVAFVLVTAVMIAVIILAERYGSKEVPLDSPAPLPAARQTPP